MAHFDIPVTEYMSAPVHGVAPDTPLPMVQHELASLRLSSLAVLEGDRLLGAISRSDLLEIGRREPGEALLSLPRRPVSEVMSGEVVTVSAEDTVSAAAERMRDSGVHRVFVTRGKRLLGVISTGDLMTAICDQRANTAIRDLMNSPIFTVDVSDSISVATERLARARISGLVVVEDDLPVGLFTQIEALECRDLDGDTPVDAVLDPAMFCVPEDTRVWRAAQQATRMGARRIIAVKRRQMSGIVGGLDFAAYVAR